MITDLNPRDGHKYALVMIIAVLVMFILSVTVIVSLLPYITASDILIGSFIITCLLAICAGNLVRKTKIHDKQMSCDHKSAGGVCYKCGREL
jgi:uncharacterized membrane protein (DUF441 family)